MPTQDFIFQGRVPVWQPTKHEGYRFNIDSLLLAAWCHDIIQEESLVVELGSGSAVVGLAMLYWNPGIRYVGIERQESLVGLSRQSIQDAGFSDRATIVGRDLRCEDLVREPANLVVFNPPYFKPGHGRSSSIVGRREAREALHGDLPAFFTAAHQHLAERGRVVAVLRPERAEEARACAEALNLQLVRTLDVVHVSGGKHQLTLYDWTTGEGEGSIDRAELALHLRIGDRTYAPEVDAFLSGDARTLSPQTLGS